MSKRFNPDNNFMSTFSKVVDSFLLGILWAICSIPVFTIGAATSALYYAYHKSVRQNRGYMWKEYFTAFKANFKQATGIWMIVLIFTALSVFTCYSLRTLRDTIPLAGFLMSIGMVIICFVIICWIYMFPYQSRFQNNMTTIMKNSALLAISNIPWSLVLFVIFVGAVIVVVVYPIICAPVAAVYIWLVNKILERIFRKLMTEEELQTEIELDRR